jgi:hypothetical protein
MFYLVLIVAGIGLYAYVKKHPEQVAQCATSLKKFLGK